MLVIAMILFLTLVLERVAPKLPDLRPSGETRKDR